MYSLDGKLLLQRAEPLDLRHQHVYPGRALVASRRALIGEAGIHDPGRCDPAD